MIARQQIYLLKNIKELPYLIKRFFPLPPHHSEEEKRERERRIVKRYAQGNISLYRGKYVTTKDIEERKDRLSKHKFSLKDY